MTNVWNMLAKFLPRSSEPWMLRNFSISSKKLKCWTVMMFLQVKLQTQNTDAHSFKYRNGFHCTTHILKTEGVCMLFCLGRWY